MHAVKLAMARAVATELTARHSLDEGAARRPERAASEMQTPHPPLDGFAVANRGVATTIASPARTPLTFGSRKE